MSNWDTQCKFLYAQEKRQQQLSRGRERRYDDDAQCRFLFYYILHNLRRFDCSSVLPLVAASLKGSLADTAVVANNRFFCYSSGCGTQYNWSIPQTMTAKGDYIQFNLMLWESPIPSGILHAPLVLRPRISDMSSASRCPLPCRVCPRWTNINVAHRYVDKLWLEKIVFTNQFSC